MKDYQSLIGIIIPTKDRPDFLRRTFSYYNNRKFRGKIYLGDGSNKENFQKTKEIIASFPELEIIQRHIANNPHNPVGVCFKEMSQIMTTPFAVFSGDDDFLVPESLTKCAEFLENHPDYSCAHGIRMEFKFLEGHIYGDLEWLRNPPELVLEQETAFDRWLCYMRYPISSQYYVHRIDTWRRMYRSLDRVLVRYFGEEVIPCSIGVMVGKVKELDCLSTVFQINEDRAFSWITHTLYDIIMHPNWSAAMATLRRELSQELIAVDKMDEQKALALLDRELWRHIRDFLNGQYYTKFEQNIAPTVAQVPLWRKIPGLTRPVSLLDIVRHLKKRLQRKKVKEPSYLNTILDKTSPYHQDFFPIYQALTGKFHQEK